MSSGKRAEVLWKVVELSEEFENERLKSRKAERRAEYDYYD